MYRKANRDRTSRNSIDEILHLIFSLLKILGVTSEQIEHIAKDMPKKVKRKKNRNKNPKFTGWYNATQIAELCGLYSINDNLHVQAVSCILNENIFISEEHIQIRKFAHGRRMAISILYDDYALFRVMQWLVDHDYPEEVYGFNRTFYIEYKEDQI